MLLMDKGSFAMIVPALPPELGEFVEQQIAAGKYHSEEDLVVDAVRILSRLAAQQHEFHDAVRLGMEQLSRGEFTQYDDQSLTELFDSLKQRAMNRATYDELQP
jgi:Arc/MetJ-type ribon-helix-helix transcriptional regulator